MVNTKFLFYYNNKENFSLLTSRAKPFPTPSRYQTPAKHARWTRCSLSQENFCCFKEIRVRFKERMSSDNIEFRSRWKGTWKWTSAPKAFTTHYRNIIIKFYFKMLLNSLLYKSNWTWDLQVFLSFKNVAQLPCHPFFLFPGGQLSFRTAQMNRTIQWRRRWVNKAEGRKKFI